MNDKYIENVLNIDTEDNKFDQYIDIFSKFLAYINPDYKYNGTFLSQYVGDFKDMCKSLQFKNEKYNDIFKELKTIKQSFELRLDGSYFAKYRTMDNIEEGYIEIDKNKVTSDVIEVRILFENDVKKYVYYKIYPVKDKDLPLKVCEEVESFMVKKGLKGE